MELYVKLTTKLDMNFFQSTSIMMRIDEPIQNLNYVPGSFSVDATSNLMYYAFKYNDIEEESSVRIYETGFGNR